MELRTTPDSEEIGITIDGEFYAYAKAQDWTLGQRAKFKKLWDEADRLEKKENPTDRDEAKYEETIGAICAELVPDAPQGQIVAIGHGGRQALVGDFFLQALKRNPLLRQMLTGSGRS